MPPVGACIMASAAPAMALPGRAPAIDRISARHLHRPVHLRAFNFGRHRRAGLRCAVAISPPSPPCVTFSTRGGSGRVTFRTRAVVDDPRAAVAPGRAFTFVFEFCRRWTSTSFRSFAFRHGVIHSTDVETTATMRKACT